MSILLPTRLLRRRSLLAALGVAALTRSALAQSISCRRLVIGTVVPVSGPYAAIGSEMLRGVTGAVEESGCGASIVVYDASRPPEQIVAATRAAVRDHANVIVGLFGPLITAAVAERAPGALVVDLRSPSTGDLVVPANAIVLPYDYFLPLVAENNASYRNHARAAVGVVLRTLAVVDQAAGPEALIADITGQRIQSPAGILLLDPASRVFRLA